ncbi:MAG: molybdopterin-binding protein, partial [Armatimonadota bacterium]
ATQAAIAEACENCDIVILSGGVSVGEYDFVQQALEAAGLKVHFSRVAIQPGKPTVYATLAWETPPQKVAFGLPGNPVSVFLTFHLFVLRAAAWMTGRRPGLREFLLPLAHSFKRRKKDRTSFVPARLTEKGAVEPVEFHGSAHLAALIRADGFMRIPAGTMEIEQGNQVTFLPIIGVESW